MEETDWKEEFFLFVNSLIHGRYVHISYKQYSKMLSDEMNYCQLMEFASAKDGELTTMREKEINKNVE